MTSVFNSLSKISIDVPLCFFPKSLLHCASTCNSSVGRSSSSMLTIHGLVHQFRPHEYHVMQCYHLCVPCVQVSENSWLHSRRHPIELFKHCSPHGSCMKLWLSEVELVKRIRGGTLQRKSKLPMLFPEDVS